MKNVIPIWCLFFIFTVLACQKDQLPTKILRQYQYTAEVTWKADGALVRLANPLGCSLRIWVNSNLNDALARRINPLVVAPQTDTTFVLPWAKDQITFSSRLGDTTTRVQPIPLGLPFPKGKEYRVLQGNQTNFTHKGPYAAFALDFDMAEGDTISSATSGIVVGVVQAYTKGGKDPKWRDYSNYLTVFDPQSGFFTQYAHLTLNGSLVEVGDTVSLGQPIGLAGSTGHSTTPHLHFACLVPAHSSEGLKSIPFRFHTSHISTQLKIGDVLSW